MVRYAGQRILQLAFVLLLGSIAVWLMIYSVPGDPATVIAGADATREQLIAVRERLGLERPLPAQYFSWLTSALRGDLGLSLTSRRPVSELLGQRIPASLQLVLISLLIGTAIALPAGIFAARRPSGWFARSVSAYQITLLAVPSFWLGILLIWLFGLHWRLLPTMSAYVPFASDPFGALRNTLLPALTLGLFMGAILTRFVRTAVAAELDRPYVRTARAKGASESRMLINHALRNAALPIVTVIGLQLGAFIGGAVITESVFNYPGVGRLAYVAVSTRDYPVVQGALMFVVLNFAIINMVVDLIYAAIDPRIKIA